MSGNQSAASIVSDIAVAVDSGYLDEEGMRLAEELKRRAEESQGSDLTLAIALQMLRHLVRKGKECQSLTDRCRAEREREKKRKERQKKYKKQLRVFKKPAESIYKMVKSREKDVVTEIQQELADRFEKEGLRDPVSEAKKVTLWRAMQNHDVAGTLELVGVEIHQVRAWKLGQTTRPPKTPYLDRVRILCQHVGMERAFLLRVMQLYADRNIAAHNSPPDMADPANILAKKDTEGTIIELEFDWVNIRNMVEMQSHRNTRLQMTGQWTSEQFNLAQAVVDQWWALHSTSWPPGDHIRLNRYARDRIPELIRLENDKEKGKFKSKATSQEPPPEDYPSSYEQGKWDDILED
ncbi:hypothetical protein QIS74_02864 [Colletotrichum tabaci]|uniref:Uncharacterized protein n=1 Tax=Colletotrichum tabaci TaxID=1209068 RepID=A0AAV9TMJ4_9PEZI